jgi:hypothetical protein
MPKTHLRVCMYVLRYVLATVVADRRSARVIAKQAGYSSLNGVMTIVIIISGGCLPEDDFIISNNSNNNK